jgi:regulator of sigma E protease
MVLLAWIIVPLLLLVAVPHELGHLLLARRFGVTVREFGLGLPPRAVSFTWRDIRWSINWLLPFGAFVTLKGEDGGDASDDFAALHPGRKALVVLAGPVANLLVAALALVLSGLLVGQPTGLRAIVTAPSRGLQTDDVLVSIDGTPVRRAAALHQALLAADGQPVSAVVERAGARVVTLVDGTPEVRARMGYAPIRTPDGVLRAFQLLAAGGDSVGLGPEHPEQVALLGWVGLAQVMQELGDVGIPGLAWFLALLASLSIGLGVMNLLPIPPLDGGRVALYGLEAFRRRRVLGRRLMTRLNVAGFALLVAMFVAVTGSDVWRLVSGQSIMAIH